jgi:hypothetical protein
MTQVRVKRSNRERRWLWICLGLLVFFWSIPEEHVEMEALVRASQLNHDAVTPEEVLDHPDYVYKRKCQGQPRATLASIKDCYPDAPLQFYGNQRNCTTPTENEQLSWSFLQHCVNGKRINSFTKITQIHIIGERNSGTKWLQQELAQCFKRSIGIRSHRDFLRSKHFFQPPVREAMDNSLVIAIVRSPEEWVAAMREKPYHMPDHMKGFDYEQPQKLPPIPLEWNAFLNRPWTMLQQTPEDQAIVQSKKQNSCKCVQGFSFQEVSPCVFNNTEIIPRTKWRGHMPIYELQRDGSGRPFEDILKLRSDKILNFFLEVPLLMQLGGFVAVRYEDLIIEGTQRFLERVAEILGMSALPSSCEPQLPRQSRLGRRKLPLEVRQWIEQKLVLETEHLLGYR